MNTWKRTKESLGLGDEEISSKVKKLVKKHEKFVEDLATVNAALKKGGLSQADKEEAETAQSELNKRVFDGDEELKAHMIRLHKDRDLNKKRRERLAANPGPGRGHKKGTDQKVTTTTQTVSPSNTTVKQPAVAATSTAATAPSTTPTPAAATASAGAGDGKTGSTATATQPAQQKTTTPAKQTTPVTTENKKTAWKAIVGFFVGGLLGAFVGKNLK